ncbi:low temperature requirement protein A [Oribacterium sp.]
MGEKIIEEAKKVNLTELFYDLVFVFGISKITHILESLESGIFSLKEIIIYIVVFVCFINVWNVQTVYMNRYGKHNLLHIMIMTVFQMPALVFMAANVSSDMEESWTAFTLALFWIAVIQFLQYTYAYTKNKHSEYDRKLIHDFQKLLFVRLLAILSSLFLSGIGRILLTGFGFILSVLGTTLFQKDMERVPINLPHLIERLTLLTIITLGEMLIAAADFFEIEKFSIYSVLILFQVVALFLFYIAEFDHAIEEKLPCQSGAGLIYNHYFVWFGLNLCTIDLDYANEAMGIARVIMMFLGLFLFYLGVFNNAHLNKKTHKLNKKLMIPFVLVYLLGLGSSFLFQSNVPVSIIFCTLTIVLETVLFVSFVVRHFPKEIRKEMIGA